MTSSKLSRSRELAAKVIFAALQILKEKGGEAPGREVLAEVEKRVQLDDWAKATYEKSGYVRWQSILHFFSIDCIKAGFLVKKKGVWYLTPEGEKALQLGDVGLLNEATAAYRRWREENQPPESKEEDIGEEGQQSQEATIHEIEQLAIEGLKNQINLKNPYGFQEFVAALLRGMGYYTPFIAPHGKDGGVDVIAYRDPLGTTSPRIKVQIKHRDKTILYKSDCVDERSVRRQISRPTKNVGLEMTFYQYSSECSESRNLAENGSANSLVTI